MSYQRLSRLFAYCVGFTCLACALYGQSTSNAPEKPFETTVCNLVAHCKGLNGRRVKFRASVMSDWFEHTALVDPKCKRGIVPRTSDGADKRPDVDAFNRALEQGKPGTTDLSITATFTGRFSCQPTSPSPSNRRVIEIEEVEALEVTKAEPAHH